MFSPKQGFSAFLLPFSLPWRKKAKRKKTKQNIVASIFISMTFLVFFNTMCSFWDDGFWFLWQPPPPIPILCNRYVGTRQSAPSPSDVPSCSADQSDVSIKEVTWFQHDCVRFVNE